MSGKKVASENSPVLISTFLIRSFPCTITKETSTLDNEMGQNTRVPDTKHFQQHSRMTCLFLNAGKESQLGYVFIFKSRLRFSLTAHRYL